MVSSTQHASFLVRLWREGEQQGEPSKAPWQGEVGHIQTTQRGTFDTLEELVSFLCQQAEGAGEPVRDLGDSCWIGAAA